jgi:hypothetical protein
MSTATILPMTSNSDGLTPIARFKLASDQLKEFVGTYLKNSPIGLSADHQNATIFFPADQFYEHGRALPLSIAELERVMTAAMQLFGLKGPEETFKAKPIDLSSSSALKAKIIAFNKDLKKLEESDHQEPREVQEPILVSGSDFAEGTLENHPAEEEQF